MRLEEKVIRVRYKVFDEGESVRPTSEYKTCLSNRVYVVERYIPPYFREEEEATVFLRGLKYGVGTEYILPAGHKYFTESDE